MNPLSGWILAGATATGKSAVAQRIAEETGTGILSADAMLVYRGMDIGTAKPLPEERRAVAYSGLDLTNPDQPFSTGLWLAAARTALREAPRPLIVAGGTGLYFKALVQGLDAPAESDPALRSRLCALAESGGLPALHAALRERGADPAALADPANPRRVIRALEILERTGSLPQGWQGAPLPRVIALRWPRAILHARIAARVEAMYAAGLLDETAELLRRYPVWSPTASAAIGYAEAAAVLQGSLSRHEAIEKTATRTRQLARRQETWLRHQTDPVWIDLAEGDTIATAAGRVLEEWRKHGPTAFTA